jgi:hypothetical protein
LPQHGPPRRVVSNWLSCSRAVRTSQTDQISIQEGFEFSEGTSAKWIFDVEAEQQQTAADSRSGTTADGSSHSEAGGGGGAVEAQVQANKRGREQS